MENRKVRAPSGVVVEEIETLPMSLTLKLKVGKHRICSHVELGSLEVQLTAIMSSLSVLEHCHSQMKGTWQANLLNASIQELSALRHLVLKFARRAPLLEAEESTSSDTLAHWAGGSQLEDPDQMRLSSDPSMSEDSVGPGGLAAPPSAPTSADGVTSRTSKSRSSKSSGSSSSPKSDESAGAADSTGRATKTRFRPSKLFSAMKGLLSKKKSRVEVNNDDQDDGEDDDPIDSEDEEQDVMSSVMPSRPAPPFRSGAAPPRYPCHSLTQQQHTTPSIRTAAQFRNARQGAGVNQRYQRS